MAYYISCIHITGCLKYWLPGIQVVLVSSSLISQSMLFLVLLYCKLHILEQSSGGISLDINENKAE